MHKNEKLNQIHLRKQKKNPYEIIYQFFKNSYTRVKIRHWKRNKTKKKRERGKALLTKWLKNFFINNHA